MLRLVEGTELEFLKLRFHKLYIKPIGNLCHRYESINMCIVHWLSMPYGTLNDGSGRQIKQKNECNAPVFVYIHDLWSPIKISGSGMHPQLYFWEWNASPTMSLGTKEDVYKMKDDSHLERDQIYSTSSSHLLVWHYTDLRNECASHHPKNILNPAFDHSN